MTTYIGPVGSLIGIKCPSELSISGGREVTLARTLSRQKAFLARAGFREWSAQLSPATTPGQVAGLAWLAEFGNPPFVWYPPDAVIGNILDPAVAGLVPGRHNGLEGPLVEVEPGLWVKSAMPDGANAVSLPIRSGSLDPIPVIPGEAITVSAWMRGATLDRGQVIALIWRDSQGNSLNTESITVGESSGSFQRRSVTRTVPVGAAQLTLQFFTAQVGGPAISITDSLRPYSPGKGCVRAVVHGLSEALTLANSQATYSGYSFTVSEVG